MDRLYKESILIGLVVWASLSGVTLLLFSEDANGVIEDKYTETTVKPQSSHFMSGEITVTTGYFVINGRSFYVYMSYYETFDVGDFVIISNGKVINK
jgi:hypothetical protein